MDAISLWRITITTGRAMGKSTFIDINERFASPCITLAKAKIVFSFYSASFPVSDLFFFQVIPSRLRLYQMQWRDTPKCRALSDCVMSSFVSAWRRNTSGSRLRGPFGPGFLQDRPSSADVQAWTLPHDTWKRRAASDLLPPFFTKSITRLRKSGEHLMKNRITCFKLIYK